MPIRDYRWHVLIAIDRESVKEARPSPTSAVGIVRLNPHGAVGQLLNGSQFACHIFFAQRLALAPASNLKENDHEIEKPMAGCQSRLVGLLCSVR